MRNKIIMNLIIFKNLFGKNTYSYIIQSEPPKKICVEDCKTIDKFLDLDE